MSTLRTLLVNDIKARVPKSWKIVPYDRSIDTPSTLTLMVKQDTIARASVARQGAFDVSYILTIIHPAEDISIAEEALDTHVLDLLGWLSTIPGLAVDPNRPAQKVIAFNRLAYDITTTYTVTLTPKD